MIEDEADGSSDVDTTVWERLDWIAVAALLVISFLLVGMHVRSYTTLSPIDELQHVDYVIKAGDLEIPHRNDLVGFEAMSEAACRSVDAPSYIGPLCGLDAYEPGNFQENGVNTSAGQYPFYYSATGLLSRGVVESGLLGSQVTAARMVGALWAGAAWSVMWYVLAVLRIPRLRRALAIGLVIATPLTLFHAATVNADSILLLTGSLTVLATVQFERRRFPWWALGLTFVLMYFVEATNMLIISACSAYLLVRLWNRPETSKVLRLTPLLVFPVLVLLRLEVASWLIDTLFPPSTPTLVASQVIDNVATRGVEIDRVVSQIDANFSPVARAYLPPFMRTTYTVPLINLVNWVLIAGMFTAAIGFVEDRRHAWLARFGAVTMLAAGPFYTFSFAYLTNTNFPAPGRFGLPLIVLAVIGVASSMRTRSAMVITGVVAGATILNTLWFLLFR
jgi:hypothetical protein